MKSHMSAFSNKETLSCFKSPLREWVFNDMALKGILFCTGNPGFEEESAYSWRIKNMDSKRLQFIALHKHF